MRSKHLLMLSILSGALLCLTGCGTPAASSVAASSNSESSVANSSFSSVQSSSSPASSASSSSSVSSATSSAVQLALNKTTLALDVGQQETLIATPSEGVIWESTDPTVASVDNGLVVGVGAGEAVITAKLNSAVASCTVTVTQKVEPAAPTISFQEGMETLTLNNLAAPSDEQLLQGVTAKDYLGNPVEVTITDKGGISTALGDYTITYSAGSGSLVATATRVAKETYYGITKDVFEKKAVSSLTDWTYHSETPTTEWDQHIVTDPVHDLRWNRFEGPYADSGLIMHGSDHCGYEAGSTEVDDEDPNTMVWNKVAVPNDSKTTFRVYCSNNPYPDYNNLLSKVRVSVLALDDWSFKAFDYTTIKAPLNAEKTGLDYDKIRNDTYVDVDLAAYKGKNVVVFIEQESPATVYQAEYFKDIGYQDFQIASMITETRDTLVVYSMGFRAPVIEPDYSTLTLDTSTSWGLDSSDATQWGLRNSGATNKENWKKFYLNEGSGSINYNTAGGGTIQSITYEKTFDGTAPVADSVLANRINISSSDFILYVGTDTDAVSDNFRLGLLSEGKKTYFAPTTSEAGYTAGADKWGTINKSQWVYGTKLTYDLTGFVGKEVVMLLEQDENWDGTEAGGRGNCTLWFNYMYFKQSIVPTLEGLDISSLALSTLSTWGTDDADGSKWGLRGATDAVKKEWVAQKVNGTVDSTANYGSTGSSIQSIAYDIAEDEAARKADVVLMNKVTVATNSLKIWVGGDADTTTPNMRLSIICNGKSEALAPATFGTGYTALDQNWGRIHVSQWVYGTELDYDMTNYVSKEAIILIEQDEYWSTADNTGRGNCTLWLNKVTFA